MRERSLFWALQAGCWLAFGAAMSIGRVGELPLRVIVVTEWVFAALGFATTLGMDAVYRRIRWRGALSAQQVLAVAAVSYLAAVAWTAAYHLYVATLAADALALLGERRDLGYTGPLLDNAVYNTMVLFAWSVLRFGVAYHRELQEERERAIRAEAEAQRARLDMLAYQLNPHFLFNTLNSIRALIDEDRRRARSMVTELSLFLRYTLLERPLQIARLTEEVAVAHGYLRIEQIRFEERLDAQVQVKPAAGECIVPAFLLHPLVENALKHGSPAGPGEPLRLRLGACVSGGRLRVWVENTGSLSARSEPDPFAPAGDRAAGGIGVRNVTLRLRQLFQDQYRFELTERDGWVRAEVELPVIRSETDVRLPPSVRSDARLEAG